MAPLRNIGRNEYRATKFNDSYKSKQLGTVLEPEDDSDVLIEGKNVYKSFGDKDILRGVSFKVGGLGDVVTGLGKALKKRGHLVEIILPKYDCMQYDGLPVYFIEPQHPDKFFWRGQFYGEHDDFYRFSFFSRAALELLLQAGKKPDIIHCHD
ncbi:probable starch synthase 4, chloroplastic/amyloplastic [Manihot esculenta]|uniref:probable starch synthase 4, chloroplastic/amyloplastic n=1 Tax=Manihot esculenta TaxID=3983 RepID=UPI001CC5D802|nr:probable starch synthase 4, chloroplastic/amyloplastic [Manihot esculenta]